MQNELKVPPSRLGTEAKRKRWLSTIVLVGHLYTRNLFDTERHPTRGREIIHTVVKQLFNSGASARSDVFDASRTPKEAHIECLVNLLLTPKLGRMVDRRAIHCVESGEVNNWFRCLADFSTRPSSVISERIRGMCAGVCDVRRMGWPVVASIAGPKLIGAGEVALVEAVGRDSAPGVASASARSAAGRGGDEEEQERTDALRDEMLKEMRDAQRITFKKVSDLTSKIQAKFQATVLSGKAINLVTVKDTEMVSKMIRMEETEFVALLAEQKVWRKAKGFVPGGGTGFDAGFGAGTGKTSSGRTAAQGGGRSAVMDAPTMSRKERRALERSELKAAKKRGGSSSASGIMDAPTMTRKETTAKKKKKKGKKGKKRR